MSRPQHLDSALYKGWVRHRRFGEKQNAFNYSIFLLALNLRDIGEKRPHLPPFFRVERFALMSFRAKNYLKHRGGASQSSVWDEVEALGGERHEGDVVLLGQLSCLGIYFSPVNFYYCHDEHGKLVYLLAEVSNTPWNRHHYYLVDAHKPQEMDKVFHVSPFMDLSMRYRWRLTPLHKRKLCVHIENHADQKVFDATLIMERHALSRTGLLKQALRQPIMPLVVLVKIYWQAIKLYVKGIPYVPYQHNAAAKENDSCKARL